jgi:uncharacterized Tic20 family protein
MMEKNVVMNNMQLGAIVADVIGIILVLVGGLVTYAHARSGAGIGLFWVGWVLLIIALIIVVMSMRKPMTKTSS